MTLVYKLNYEPNEILAGYQNYFILLIEILLFYFQLTRYETSPIDSWRRKNNKSDGSKSAFMGNYL